MAAGPTSVVLVQDALAGCAAPRASRGSTTPGVMPVRVQDSRLLLATVLSSLLRISGLLLEEIFQFRFFLM